MRILVTGTEGYLGSLLAPTLLGRGDDVVGLDTGYYKNGWLYNGVHETPRTLVKDIRHVTPDDLAGFDAVVHMAELSNDPIGDRIGDVTYEINHHGSVHLADAARRAGVSRFVYMSSCSVYGVAEGTVKSRCSRARQKLAGLLQYFEGDERQHTPSAVGRPDSC